MTIRAQHGPTDARGTAAKRRSGGHADRETDLLDGVDVLVTDLDGVLRTFDDDLWTRLDAELELSPGTAMQAILGHPVLRAVIRGRGTHAQWREAAAAALVADGVSPDAARDAVAQWAGTPGRVDEEVAALLRDARARGAAVFVFTNGTDSVAAEMAELGLDEFTAPAGAHLLNSADLRAAKPEVLAFSRAHGRIENALGRGVMRERVRFLDDRSDNVSAAEAFGWRATLWTR